MPISEMRDTGLWQKELYHGGDQEQEKGMGPHTDRADGWQEQTLTNDRLLLPARFAGKASSHLFNSGAMLK